MQKDGSRSIIPIERIEKVIYIMRGHKILLDRDLALLYNVETRALVQAVKRNIERFPDDFMFQLTKEEFKNWKSQIVTSNSSSLISQIVISKKGRGGIRKCPYAFTEQGVAMLSSVLRSPQAIEVNIEIMRTFIRFRQTLASHKEIAKELAELKSFVLKKSNQNNQEFRRIWQAIEKLSAPEEERRRIGFDLS